MFKSATPFILIIILLTSLLCGAVELKEDPPVRKPPESGSLRGEIDAAESVSDLSAISRVSGQTYTPKTFDTETGQFVFDNLPGATRYDLRFTVGSDRIIEGINLDFVDRELIELAEIRRSKLGVPRKDRGKFTEDDVEQIRSYIRDMEDFMEKRRVLYIRGEENRATVLVELMRTRDFHDGAGQYVWRVELWYFENFRDGWVKLPNQERVLRRMRNTPKRWSETHVEYYPELSVRIARDGSSEPINFRVPKQPDDSRGRVSGTDPRIKTDPHILKTRDARCGDVRPPD